MRKQKRNILTLIISLVVSCTLIPIGLTKGWGIIDYVIGIASFFISGLIIYWNNEAAFHRSSWSDSRIGYHFIGFFCLTFGIQGLGGCWGEALLVKVMGAALTIIGAILIRLACRAKCDKPE